MQWKYNNVLSLRHLWLCVHLSACACMSVWEGNNFCMSNVAQTTPFVQFCLWCQSQLLSLNCWNLTVLLNMFHSNCWWDLNIAVVKNKYFTQVLDFNNLSLPMLFDYAFCALDWYFKLCVWVCVHSACTHRYGNPLDQGALDLVTWPGRQPFISGRPKISRLISMAQMLSVLLVYSPNNDS